LVSAELPAAFWFHAVQHATEVCNYFPLKLTFGKLSIPVEPAHQVMWLEIIESIMEIAI
jgi:hypothetical protein